MSEVNKKVRKLFNITVKSIDEEKRQASFVFSDDSIDRYGEKVDQSWDTKNYEKNPVVLWGHDPSLAENVIGSAVELQIDQGGKSILTAQFDDDEHSSLIFNKIKKGILRTVSAGFIPHTVEYEDDVPVLKDNELLEVSVVAIPANPNAVALGVKAGEINTKDAQWLMKTMRDEADAIEAELKAAEEDERDPVAELTTAVSDLTEALEAMKGELEELKAGKQEDEEGDDEDDPAKGGDHDQPGAAEVEDIDLDAEVEDDSLDDIEIVDEEETPNE